MEPAPASAWSALWPSASSKIANVMPADVRILDMAGACIGGTLRGFFLFWFSPNKGAMSFSYFLCNESMMEFGLRI